MPSSSLKKYSRARLPLHSSIDEDNRKRRKTSERGKRKAALVSSQNDELDDSLDDNKTFNHALMALLPSLLGVSDDVARVAVLDDARMRTCSAFLKRPRINAENLVAINRRPQLFAQTVRKRAFRDVGRINVRYGDVLEVLPNLVGRRLHVACLDLTHKSDEDVFRSLYSCLTVAFDNRVFAKDAFALAFTFVAGGVACEVRNLDTVFDRLNLTFLQNNYKPWYNGQTQYNRPGGDATIVTGIIGASHFDDFPAPFFESFRRFMLDKMPIRTIPRDQGWLDDLEHHIAAFARDRARERAFDLCQFMAENQIMKHFPWRVLALGEMSTRFEVSLTGADVTFTAGASPSKQSTDNLSAEKDNDDDDDDDDDDACNSGNNDESDAEDDDQDRMFSLAVSPYTGQWHDADATLEHYIVQIRSFARRLARATPEQRKAWQKSCRQQSEWPRLFAVSGRRLRMRLVDMLTWFNARVPAAIQENDALYFKESVESMGVLPPLHRLTTGNGATKFVWHLEEFK